MTDTRFTLPASAYSLPDPAAVITFPAVRFTLLSSRLIRIEISPTGAFEDRPTQQFWYRHQPLPPVQINPNLRGVEIRTEHFELLYEASGRKFTSKSITVTLPAGGRSFHLDDPNPGQLPGTARTLDGSRGPVHLQPGLVSRGGWVQLDDTPSLVFNAAGWLEERPKQRGYRDLYLLISDGDYPAAVRDYQRVSGTPPLLPRAFLGNWWSRYWEYSQAEIKDLVERFGAERIPLSVFIIDMDWHITRTGNASSGWTGFSWNRTLFPDPPELIQWLHNHQLLTSLNLHPADGIFPHEDQYPAAARALGVNPAKKKPIPFDIASEKFTRVYFDILLHPLEEQGVDFWWIDWQQGEASGVKGLDPLWWLNHLHFNDLARGGKKRPVIFSRWGGVGAQRYPIGFSGDTVVSWEALAYQPYFTAAAANAAYGWWSHDVGGHMDGMEDKELYTRWVQFGVVSPIFRLHCSKTRFVDRTPWSFDANTLELTRSAMQFRQALVPYLYTMAQRNAADGDPLITPLYYAFPADESSYLAGGQYLFGSELMAAPVVAPLDPELNLSRQMVWFPPGEWFNFFNGDKFCGPQWKILYRGIEDMPLYARAGAIVPLQTETVSNGTANPAALEVVVFPGADGNFTVYEDDGVTTDYLLEGGCETPLTSHWHDGQVTVEVGTPGGAVQHLPEERTFRILLRGVAPAEQITATVNGEPVDTDTWYNAANRTIMIGPISLKADEKLAVTAKTQVAAGGKESEAAIWRLLQRAPIETDSKWRIDDFKATLGQDAAILKDTKVNLTYHQRLALLEMATGAGAAVVGVPDGEMRLVLINPKQNPRFKVKGKGRIRIDPQGMLLPEVVKTVEVDYFGWLHRKVSKP